MYYRCLVSFSIFFVVLIMRPILSVIILVIKKSDDRDFVNYSYDSRPNWTPLGPTMFNCWTFSV